MIDWINKYLKDYKKFWYIPFMVLVGIILMISASNGDERESEAPAVDHSGYIEQVERRISEMLMSIEGAGTCKVTVLLASGGAMEYVREAGNVLVITDKDGNEAPVLVREGTPEISGVTITSTGAGSVAVRNRIIEAVSTLLGIGTNKICVVMMS